jgi:hypothetical protein
MSSPTWCLYISCEFIVCRDGVRTTVTREHARHGLPDNGSSLCDCRGICYCDQTLLLMNIYREEHPDVCIYQNGEWMYKTTSHQNSTQLFNGQFGEDIDDNTDTVYLNPYWLSNRYTTQFIDKQVNENGMHWDDIISITIKYYTDDQ